LFFEKEKVGWSLKILLLGVQNKGGYIIIVDKQ
jgi:hypothetical protein